MHAILLEYDEPTAARRQDDEIHHDQHQVVVPAVGSATPEPDLPDEDFFLNGAEHDQDQPDCGKLREDPERDPDAAGHFRGAEKYREAGTRPDALRALDGIFEVIPTAIEEHNGDHEAQEQEADVREFHQRGKQNVHVYLIGASG